MGENGPGKILIFHSYAKSRGDIAYGHWITRTLMINHGILIHKPRAKTGIAILNVFLAESIINNLPQSEVSNTKKTYLYGLVRANLQEPLEKIRKKHTAHLKNNIETYWKLWKIAIINRCTENLKSLWNYHWNLAKVIKMALFWHQWRCASLISDILSPAPPFSDLNIVYNGEVSICFYIFIKQNEDILKIFLIFSSNMFQCLFPKEFEDIPTEGPWS